MRFLIVGAGAVGGFVAARLADAGHNVTALVRPHSAAQLPDEGLRVASQPPAVILRHSPAHGEEPQWPMSNTTRS